MLLCFFAAEKRFKLCNFQVYRAGVPSRDVSLLEASRCGGVIAKSLAPLPRLEKFCLSTTHNAFPCWSPCPNVLAAIMRAIPTWVDKVHDKDKVEQWWATDYVVIIFPKSGKVNELIYSDYAAFMISPFVRMGLNSSLPLETECWLVSRHFHILI